MNKAVSLIAVICICCAACFAQVKDSAKSVVAAPATQDVDPPGNINLLPGYAHEKKQGYDTSVGDISKKDGMVIRYDIGALARDTIGAPADDPFIWYKKQEVNNQQLLIGLTKNGKIRALFSFQNYYANFYANTKSQEDVADFLLMILTYKRESKNK